MFGYFGSCSFMYLIQAFWFVALAAAERMPMSPLDPICLASRSTWDVPIVLVSAWLMNRWLGALPQEMSESNETIAMPFFAAWFSDGHSADGSLPAMTIASALAWIAAWIDGIWAAAVSSVPLETTTLPPSSCRAFAPPSSARTSYGFCVSLGMK